MLGDFGMALEQWHRRCCGRRYFVGSEFPTSVLANPSAHLLCQDSTNLRQCRFSLLLERFRSMSFCSLDGDVQLVSSYPALLYSKERLHCHAEARNLLGETNLSKCRFASQD